MHNKEIVPLLINTCTIRLNLVIKLQIIVEYLMC